jgi:hypothetical protein
MPIYIAILPLGETSEMKCWSESTTASVNQDEWDDLAIRLAHENSGNRRFLVEVFLCLHGQLDEAYNYNRLAETLRYAREHVWGAPIYLVVAVNFRLQPEQRKHQATWAKFFEVIHQARVVDLIENAGLFEGRSAPSGAMLRVLADEASERRRRLQRLSGIHAWKCVVRPETDALLAEFLTPFVSRDAPALSSDNRIIVCTNSRKPTTRSFIEKNVTRRTGTRQVVANLVADADFQRWLDAECNLRRIDLLDFGGVLELRFSLVRLNHLNPYYSGEDRIEMVPVAPSTLFNAERVGGTPRLLVTNGFDPNDTRDSILCLEAADEAGELKHQSPPDALTDIYQSVTCERLPGMVESADLTVWVYQGHGDGERGLQESRAGRFGAPGRWRDCFSNYQNGLPLVVFSACRSTHVARLFAEAGAGVAIGFESDVTSSAAKLLTTDVVTTALQTRGNQREILEAFRRGCGRLTARGYISSGPKAFWTSRPNPAL